MENYYPNLTPVLDVLHTIKKTFVKLAKRYTKRTTVADILTNININAVTKATD